MTDKAVVPTINNTEMRAISIIITIQHVVKLLGLCPEGIGKYFITTQDTIFKEESGIVRRDGVFSSLRRRLAFSFLFYLLFIQRSGLAAYLITMLTKFTTLQLSVVMPLLNHHRAKSAKHPLPTPRLRQDKYSSIPVKARASKSRVMIVTRATAGL